MNCSFSLKVFESRHDIADELVKTFLSMAGEKRKTGAKLNVALSGGSTPLFFYKALANEAEKDSKGISGIRFFWVDERCVPPDSKDSNFFHANELLFSRLAIPDDSIFRIRGEDSPGDEAQRYSELLAKELPVAGGFPVFDLVMLGVGRDGHTASLFPMSSQLYEREKPAVVSENPDTGRKRITLTLPVICNAEKIIFLVTGADKRDIVRILCKSNREDPLFPASFVKTDRGNIEWYVDSDAWSTWPQDSD